MMNCTSTACKLCFIQSKLTDNSRSKVKVDIPSSFAIDGTSLYTISHSVVHQTKP